MDAISRQPQHEGRVYKKEVNVGSPPPTRGTLRPKNSAIAGRRITPAYAGNTSKNLLANPDLQDHPRLRGEHDGFKIFYALNVGSPPPTRGTPQSKKFIKAIRGITPAYAGNTRGIVVKIPNGQDHPRLRGEHPFPYRELFAIKGSPPPTRGTQNTS